MIFNLERIMQKMLLTKLLDKLYRTNSTVQWFFPQDFSSSSFRMRFGTQFGWRSVQETLHKCQIIVSAARVVDRNKILWEGLNI